MKIGFSSLAMICVLLALPAKAETYTFTGEDRHLYLNEIDGSGSTSLISGWKVPDSSIISGGGALRRRVSSLNGDIFISKGPFRISKSRFLEILETSGADPKFVARHSLRTDLFWPAMALGSGLTAIGGAVTTGVSAWSIYPTGVWIGGVIALIGFAGSWWSVPNALSQAGEQTPWYWDEVYDAILKYNQSLDASQSAGK